MSVIKSSENLNRVLLPVGDGMSLLFCNSLVAKVLITFHIRNGITDYELFNSACIIPILSVASMNNGVKVYSKWHSFNRDIHGKLIYLNQKSLTTMQRYIEIGF